MGHQDSVEALLEGRLEKTRWIGAPGAAIFTRREILPLTVGGECEGFGFDSEGMNDVAPGEETGESANEVVDSLAGLA